MFIEFRTILSLLSMVIIRPVAFSSEMSSASSSDSPNPALEASSSATHNPSRPPVLDILCPGDFTPGLEEGFPDLVPLELFILPR